MVQLKEEFDLEVSDSSTVSSAMNHVLGACSDDAKKLLISPAGQLNALVLVNFEQVKPNQTLKNGDQLIFVRMVSGG